ncbi:type III-B CRISPR module RAMP protein Cmr1 [Aggregatilineales bacterium SYSU G02658]
MPKVEFILETVSPLFLNGANSRTPDLLRAASVRGQLRYWFRAIKGASINSSQRLFEEEAKVFGTTDSGSPVTIRMWTERDYQPQSVPMLPHRRVRGIGDGGNESRADAFAEGIRIHLQLVTRPGVPFPRDFLKALATWQLIGGVGKRSRRTFGAMQHIQWQPSEDAKFPSPLSWWQDGLNNLNVDNYLAALNRHFEWAFKDLERTQHSSFPALMPDTSRIVVSRQHYGSAEEANQEAFRLIRSRNHPAGDGTVYYNLKNQGPFGGVGRPVGRLASPLHVQVRRLAGGRYHLVFTAMANALSAKHRQSLKQFMADAVTEYDGVTVWGTL